LAARSGIGPVLTCRLTTKPEIRIEQPPAGAALAGNPDRRLVACSPQVFFFKLTDRLTFADNALERDGSN
jgi:hypothetical protein